jgi:hypothetical protein
MKQIFSPHLLKAHSYWKAHLKPGDRAVDATCGNGHDTLVLSQILLSDPRSAVFGYDIQSAAIEKTRQLLQTHLSEEQMQQVHLFHQSHAEIEGGSVQLIVYNLGYLPGGDKTIVTQVETTLKSVEYALSLLETKGALSITCYPGHEEGEREERALLEFFEKMPSSEASVCYHKWLNRPRSPTLLWVVKE